MPAVEQDLTQGSVTRKLVRYALHWCVQPAAGYL